MKTAKEKAKELVDKYYYLFLIKLENTIDYRSSKKCALIALNEVLDFMMNDDKESETCYWANHPTLDYWYNVKHEIENL